VALWVWTEALTRVKVHTGGLQCFQKRRYWSTTGPELCLTVVIPAPHMHPWMWPKGGGGGDVPLVSHWGPICTRAEDFT
jgi:hypothetical protein